jgi:hypothetical protein
MFPYSHSDRRFTPNANPPCHPVTGSVGALQSNATQSYTEPYHPGLNGFTMYSKCVILEPRIIKVPNTFSPDVDDTNNHAEGNGVWQQFGGTVCTVNTGPEDIPQELKENDTTQKSNADE